jgi:hypothetical protein
MDESKHEALPYWWRSTFGVAAFLIAIVLVCSFFLSLTVSPFGDLIFDSWGALSALGAIVLTVILAALTKNIEGSIGKGKVALFTVFYAISVLLFIFSILIFLFSSFSGG